MLVWPSSEDKYKVRLIEVGKAIRDSYIARKSRARFQREVLQARDQHRERWLWDQLKLLQEESEGSFDAQQIWSTLVPTEESDVHELLYLLRLLWTAALWLSEHI